MAVNSSQNDIQSNTIHLWLGSSDTALAEVLSRALGTEVEVCQSDDLSSESLEEARNWSDVALLDLQATGCDENPGAAQAALQHLTRSNGSPATPVIVIVDEADLEAGRNAMEMGAYEALTGPPKMMELRLTIRRAFKFQQTERELRQLRQQSQSNHRLHDLIGFSEPMQQVFSLAQKTASCDVTVLVTGETGTGKGLLTRAIHHLSSRRAGPFVSFSCANLPETLVEDELFGHEKGAFTGAIALRRGRFEAADRGTLFLDEIGDLPLGLQSKLLRVLQERCFERLGSNTPVSTDLRLICATHKNLAQMVEEGQFRQDLFYRLNVVQVHLPPLRERREEIPVLALHFLERFAGEFGKGVHRITRTALQAMEEYEWPGNVRELENIIQRAVVLAEGPTVEVGHLPAKLREGFAAPRSSSTYEEEVRNFRRRLLLRTLQECNWCKVEAARKLGVARSYLHRLITQMEITQPELDVPPPRSERDGPGTRIM